MTKDQLSFVEYAVDCENTNFNLAARAVCQEVRRLQDLLFQLEIGRLVGAEFEKSRTDVARELLVEAYGRLQFAGPNAEPWINKVKKFLENDW